MGRLWPLLWLAALSQPASAWERPQGFLVDLSASTHFPVDVSARLGLEFPARVLLSTSVGVMPRPYLNALNSVLVDFAVYDRRTAELVATTLDQSLVSRTQLGWRPVASSGLYFQVGYTLVTLGGGVTEREALSILTGTPIPEDAGPTVLVARASVHQVCAELGWQGWIGDRFTFAFSVSGFGTVAASSRISARAPEAVNVLFSPLARAGEAYLNRTFRRYVHGASLNFRLGFRLF